MHKDKALIIPPKIEIALRASEFALMPTNPKSPIVTSHPIRNFQQLTWARPGSDGPVLTKSVPLNNSVSVLQGTAVEWSFYVSDPSNVNNFNDIRGLSYLWKKDGQPLYKLNKLNKGNGTRNVFISRDESVPAMSGEYVCEVSNGFGTVSTVPFILTIINIDDSGMLYANLLKNGDGEGGLDGWISPSGKITAKTFHKKTGDRVNTLPVFDVEPLKLSTPHKEIPFTFSQTRTGKENYFYSLYKKIKDSNPGININNLDDFTYNDDNDSLYGFFSNHGAQLIPNEDYSVSSSPGSWFPGPYYLDRYNRNYGRAKNNKSAQALLDESSSERVVNYLTRDKIAFSESPAVQFHQDIDITSAASMVNGFVGGVDTVSAQLFAYVGIGITGFKIKVQVDGEVKEYPWYIHDMLSLLDQTTKDNIKGGWESGGISPLVWWPANNGVGSSTGNGPHYKGSDPFLQWLDSIGGYEGVDDNTQFSDWGERREARLIAPDIGTDIEIIPIANDTTELEVEFLDSSDNRIGLKKRGSVFKGPTIEDIWAVKEKVYFPMTLFPIFIYFKPGRDNNIKVFGQTYTNTNSLTRYMRDLFGTEALFGGFDISYNSNAGNGNPALNQYNPPTVTDNGFTYDLGSFIPNPMSEDSINSFSPTEIDDKNATWILKNFAKTINTWGHLYPGSNWISEYNNIPGVWSVDTIDPELRKIAFPEKGGAALFAVGGNVKIPPTAAKIRVNVRFINDSLALNDTAPDSKGWTDPHIYRSLYSTDALGYTSAPIYTYGEPKCCVSKMKLLLIPNNDFASQEHITYAIPPSEFTVAGLAKIDLHKDTHNSATKPEFSYNLIMPEGLPPSPEPTTTSQDIVELQVAYNDALESEALANANLIPTGGDQSNAATEEAFLIQKSITQEDADQELENP